MAILTSMFIYLSRTFPDYFALVPDSLCECCSYKSKETHPVFVVAIHVIDV